MTTKDAINRGHNLVGVSIASLAGIAFAAEILLEPEWLFKIDDILLVLLGIVAVVWYRRGKNRFQRSLAPVLFAYSGIAIKLLAIILEIKDKEDVGDDFGGLTLFIAASVLMTVLYILGKRLLQESK